MKGDHPQVLVTNAVKAFDALLKVASHSDGGEGTYPYPQPCVYLQMHWVQMRSAGWKDVDFDAMTAVSGASGLFAYQPKTFMPKYANLMIGMDRRIAEATGFGYEWVKFADAEDAWRIIRDSVDAGRPVKGWHYENCAFLGYQDAPRAEGRKLYTIGDGPGTFSKWWTWKEFADWVAMVGKWNQRALGRHTKRLRQQPARAVALRVMKDLVAWSARPPAACTKRFAKATFGLAGIEAYAADCADVATYKDWTMCHDINPQWTVRNSSAVYLRRLAKGNAFPGKVAKHIAAAAGEYESAFRAWHEAYGLLGHGATKQQRRSKQRRQAGAAVVRQALNHEKAAVAALGRALAAAGEDVAVPAAARVRREGRRAWVADVPRPAGVNSVLASLTAVLQAAGEDVTYEHLMGVSGRAFRLQFNWCPSAPHSYCGFNTFQPALRAVGYRAAPHPGGGFKDQKKADIEEGRAAVRAGIDAGLPCLFGSEEEGVLVGYEPPGKDATGWLCRPGPLGGPPKPNEPYLRPVKKPPWGVRVLSKAKAAAPPRRERIVWSLKTAVANAGRKKIDGYAAGFAAWEKWIAELEDFDKAKRDVTAALAKDKRPHADKDVLFHLALGNAWCFESLIDARQAAAGYLRSVAGEFPKAPAGHLRRAADHYEAVAKLLSKQCPTKTAPYPWMLKDVAEAWTDAMRSAQAGMLKAALARERKAVAEIQEALAAM